MCDDHNKLKGLLGYRWMRLIRLYMLSLALFSGWPYRLYAEAKPNSPTINQVFTEFDTSNYSRIGLMSCFAHRNLQNLAWFGVAFKGPIIFCEKLQSSIVGLEKFKGLDFRIGYRHSLSADILIGGYMLFDVGPERWATRIMGLELISTTWRISCNGHYLQPFSHFLCRDPCQWGMNGKGAIMISDRVTGFIGGYYRTVPLPNHPRIYTFNYTAHDHNVMPTYTTDYMDTYSCLRGVKSGIVLGMDWDYDTYNKIGVYYTQDSINGGSLGLNYQCTVPVPTLNLSSTPRLRFGSNIKQNLLKLPHYHVGPPIETVLVDYLDSDALRTMAWHQFITSFMPSTEQYERKINTWSKTWAERLNINYDMSKRQEALKLWIHCDKAERIRLWQWLAVNDVLRANKLPTELRLMIRDRALLSPSHSMKPEHLDVLYDCFGALRQDKHAVDTFTSDLYGANCTMKIQVELQEGRTRRGSPGV